MGARVSYTNYSYDYTLYGVEVDVKPDDNLMCEGNLTYFIRDCFSLELSVGYVETDVDLSALGLSLDAGELENTPVILSGRLHFYTNPKMNQYISFGVGYFFNDFDQND